MLENNIDCPKPDAALWAINCLPNECKPALERARSICLGKTNEYWDDIAHLIQPCADFMTSEIEEACWLMEHVEE